MRSAWIALGVLGLAACSSSSSSKVVRDGPDASNDSGGAGDSGNVRDSGNLTDRGGENDVGTGSDAGDAGDASVATGPVVFDPTSIELRANTSVQARLRFRPESGFTGTLEVTLAIENPTPSDAGGASPALSLSRTTFLLSSSVAEESFEVTASAAAAQGAYAIRATARAAGGTDPLTTATLPANVIGRPGELDTTFGNRGYFDYQPEGNCNAEAVVALPDGRFVVVGQALTSNMLIARFQGNGEIDNTFGPNGNGRLVVNRGFGRPNAVLLPDGKVLVAYDNNNLINLVKILPNGTVDPDWGANGVLPTEISPGNHTPLAVDSGGSILIGGDYYDDVARSSRAAIVRLTAAGAVDTSFGGDGRVEIKPNQPIEQEGHSGVEALTLQSNGNIVGVGGYLGLPNTVPQGGDQHFTFRVQSNGQPDSTFGLNGVQRTKFGTNQFGNYESAMAVLIQKSGANAGKVVAAGFYRQEASTPYLLGLARHGASGSLDSTFLGGGKGTHNLANNDEDFPGEMILEPDDGMLVQIHSGQATRFIVARLNANGALDTAWGTGGTTTAIPGRAFGMAQNGRYLLVVGAAQPSPEPVQAARIARFWLR